MKNSELETLESNNSPPEFLNVLKSQYEFDLGKTSSFNQVVDLSYLVDPDGDDFDSWAYLDGRGPFVQLTK